MKQVLKKAIENNSSNILLWAIDPESPKTKSNILEFLTNLVVEPEVNGDKVVTGSLTYSEIEGIVSLTADTTSYTGEISEVLRRYMEDLPYGMEYKEFTSLLIYLFKESKLTLLQFDLLQFFNNMLKGNYIYSEVFPQESISDEEQELSNIEGNISNALYSVFNSSSC